MSHLRLSGSKAPQPSFRGSRCRLLGRLLWILVGIIGAVAVLLAYIVRQSMKIEQQRTRSDSALRESHEKYRALVEVTTEGIVMVLDGRCAYLNHAMLEMLGYHEDEALLLDLHDLFSQDAGPAGTGADFVLFSPRKFLGVPDGGVLAIRAQGFKARVAALPQP